MRNYAGEQDPGSNERFTNSAIGRVAREVESKRLNITKARTFLEIPRKPTEQLIQTASGSAYAITKKS
jgi:hypothetical protein